MAKQKIDFSGFRDLFPDAVVGSGKRFGEYLVIYEEDRGESHLYAENGLKKIAVYKQEE